MSNFESRIRTLERRDSAGDPESLRLLMGICHREGGVMPSHAALEGEIGRRIDPALAKRAERLLVDMERFRVAAELSTNGSLREALKAEARKAAEGAASERPTRHHDTLLLQQGK